MSEEKETCDRCGEPWPGDEKTPRYLGMVAKWENNPEWDFKICPPCWKEVMTQKPKGMEAVG